MAYRKVEYIISEIGSCETYEGETIEQKIERVIHGDEPIEDGAPEIFTEKADGVIAAYNIRTDRWEVAADAMHLVHTSQKMEPSNIASRDNKPLGEKTGTDEGGA